MIVTITAQLYAPSNISFPFPGGVINYTTGVAVNVTASISGIVTSCSVSPSLPAGLSLNTTTCAITGTPTGTSPAKNYTITASNASGSTNTTVTIGVNPPAPSNLVYPASNALSFAVGTAKTITPTKTGTVTNCVASPSLPSGLTINATTCAIGGTATVEQTSTAYVITASNAGGNTTANITLTFFGKLPFKTGQTQCYDVSGNVIACAGTGQDGEYQSGQPAAVYSGPNQHPTYTDDYTTTDTTSGLVWQSCPTGLSGADCTNGSFNNSYANDCAYLNSLNGGVGYAGRNDWRYPTTQEIDRFGILYNTNSLMQNNFPNQSSRNYSGGSLDRVGKAFIIKLLITEAEAHGSALCNNNIKPNASMCTANVALKCVAGIKNHKEPKTVIINNDYVIDANNGILWRKCSEGITGSDCEIGNPTLMSWDQAINYCKNVNYLGKTWRLPNMNEAMTIYISLDEFFLNPDFPWDGGSMWTSTTIEGDSTKAFKVEWPGRDKKLKTSTNRVRCISVAQ